MKILQNNFASPSLDGFRHLILPQFTPRLARKDKQIPARGFSIAKPSRYGKIIRFHFFGYTAFVSMTSLRRIFDPETIDSWLRKDCSVVSVRRSRSQSWICSHRLIQFYCYRGHQTSLQKQRYGLMGILLPHIQQCWQPPLGKVFTLNNSATLFEFDFVSASFAAPLSWLSEW